MRSLINKGNNTRRKNERDAEEGKKENETDREERGRKISQRNSLVKEQRQ